MTVRVLFVCMGNICRSPTAEAVFRHHAGAAGAAEWIVCDSAGTHDYHIGEPPDARAQEAALRRGYAMSDLRGRQVTKSDFLAFDHVLAMDHRNRDVLTRLCPPRLHDRVRLFTDFSRRFPGIEVPDPYYGDTLGFDRVLDIIEETSQSLLSRLLADIGPQGER